VDGSVAAMTSYFCSLDVDGWRRRAVSPAKFAVTARPV